MAKRTIIVANRVSKEVLYTQILSNVYGGLSERDHAAIDAIYGAVSGTPEDKIVEIYPYETASKSYGTVDDCMKDFIKVHGTGFAEPKWFNAALHIPATV